MDYDILWIILGTLLLVGIIGSFVPQYIEFYKKKSNEGISSYFMFVSTLSTNASFVNAMIFYRDAFDSCLGENQMEKINSSECYGEILGFLQILTLWLCLLVQYSLFIYYAHNNRNPNIPPNYQNNKEFDRIVFVIHLLISVGFIAIGIFVDTKKMDHHTYAHMMGLISLIGGVTQYLPQLYKTFRYKRIGSLSIISMMIQVPGSYVWVIFLFFQSSSNLTTWIPYLVSGTLQLILFLMCLYIKYKLPPSSLLIIDDELLLPV
jgi:uncharacterized protein with PQ loop repeat